jgi:ABC-2 type transport system permease protein
MRKIWAITRKDLYATFTDPALLLIMLAAPLAVATIIGVTFSGVGGANAAPVTDIPVAFVTLDAGVEQGGATQNNGAILRDILIPPDDLAADSADTAAERSPEAAACGYTPRRADASFDNSLWKLIHAVPFDDPAAARACVDNGAFAAAVVVPAEFSANLAYGPANPNLTPTEIEVYSDPDRPIAASIVGGVIDGIGAQLAAGNIAVAAVIDRYIAENPLNFARLGEFTGSPAFADGAEAAFGGGEPLLTVTRQTVAGAEATFNPLVFIGASQAIFFALFTASGGATSIIEERRNWTLQRLLISPTSQLQILLGKMIGVYATVLVQLGFLFIAFTLVGSLLAGELQFIWGTNLPAILLILLTSTLAVTGLGAITAAAARTPDQAGTIGAIVSLFSAVFGGAFGFNLGAPLNYFSVVYWGSDAFSTLASGGGAVALNALVLVVFGVVTFALALYIFNRRLEDR